MKHWNPDAPLDAAVLTKLGADLADEEFTNRSRVHNWRNHVGDSLKAIWGTLSDETRGAIYLMAEWEAQSEEWE